MCYTSQRNWVIIKMLYRYLRRCLLSWHRSRLGFVTLSIGEVSLGPLGNTHHKLAGMPEDVVQKKVFPLSSKGKELTWYRLCDDIGSWNYN